VNVRAGVFTGAGMSHDAPAGLPLGRGFHRLLADACYADAMRIAPDIVDRAVLGALDTGNWNLLARIESTMPGAGSGAVAAMKITIPNEAHLLAAIHLAHGGYQLTVNFDDGVETAYQLLSGAVQFGAEVPLCFHDALVAWRRCFPVSAPPLRVISDPEGFASASFGTRPLLVKLHGSLGIRPDGIVLSLPTFADEPEVHEIGRDRLAAYDELGRHPLVIVTGFSGTDPASASPVFARLRPGAFRWVAPEVTGAVRSTLAAIDADQPVTGVAADAIRSVLPVDPPPWPGDASGAPGYEDRIRAWLVGLPIGVAAEAFAWTLADSGLHEAAIPLLERLVEAEGSRMRTRIRLADARWTRAEPGDRRIASKAFGAAAVQRDRDVGGYARRRWAECMTTGSEGSAAGLGQPLRFARLPAVLAATVRADRDGPMARAHAATILAGLVLSEIEPRIRLEPAFRSRRSTLAGAAELTRRVVDRALVQSAGLPGGRRRALLRRQSVELMAISALLRGRPLSMKSVAATSGLIRTCQHLSDGRGLADAFATQAIVWLTRGDVGRAAESCRQAQAVEMQASGVVTLAGQLLRRSSATGLSTAAISRR
jgi:hypothetical protein